MEGNVRESKEMDENERKWKGMEGNGCEGKRMEWIEMEGSGRVWKGIEWKEIKRMERMK